MKKKILSVIAAVASLSAIALVGCGGDEHTHKYEWKYEGNAHWQECECGNKKSNGTHEDNKINATKEAGKDELCDLCGADLHVHDYVWKSTAAVHWQECKCGDKTAEEAHKDVKNNESKADGADELCDDCGRGYYAVTFNLGGHGTVATQHIGKDGKVQEPETPADDDSWKFKGWYKDSEHKTKFDFATETVTAATEIYAWFEDDLTPGASKNHAYALVLDELNPQKAQKGKVAYYSFKATVSGRYTLSLGAGTNNENATFTTTKTGGTKYGKDCTAAEVTVDVNKGETVYILFTFLGEEGNDVVVSPLVTEVTNEPMPADHFLAGEYFNATMSLEITDRTDAEHQTLTFNDTAYPFRYIGGSFDRIYFTQSTVGQGDVTYYLSHHSGKYFLSTDGNSSSSEMEYYVQQTPVALNKVVGYYEPVSTSGGGTGGGGQGTITPKPDGDKDTSNTTGGIIGLYIYDNTLPNATSVRLKTKSTYAGKTTIAYSDLLPATYNTDKNRLYFDTYAATLKLNASGEVEGIVVGGVTFVRKGDAGAVPPEKIDLLENIEYTGDKYVIRDTGYSQYFGATGYDAIYLMSFDSDDGMCGIDVVVGSNIVSYKLKLSENQKTIYLYDEDGKKLLDTLTANEWNIIDLPTSEATDDIPADGFQKGLRLYKAQEAGWYSFTIPANATGLKNLNPTDYTDFEYTVEIQSGKAVYLAADELIAVYMETPAAVSVSVARPAAPVGTSVSNPKALENGMAVMDAVDAPTYYFTYTAPSAGNYLVSVVVDGYSVLVLYTVNGTQYGYNGMDWLGGVTYSNPYAAITVDDELTLNIQVVGELGWSTVSVAVSEDYSENATDLTLTGTPADNSLTVTTTAATGANYHIASTKGEDVTVTGNAAFTVKVQGGAIVTAEQSGENYTATISAGVDVYFKLESDTQQNLTLSQTFAKGTEGYPNAVTLSEGSGTYTVAAADDGDWQSAYISIAPGTYEVSAPVQYVQTPWGGSDYATINLYVNYVNDASISEYYEIADEAYVWNITVFDGDVLYITHECEDAVELTFTKLVKLFEEEQVGTFVGKDTEGNDVKLTFDVYGKGVYFPFMEYDIHIKQEGTGYSFTYDGDGNTVVKVTFSLDGNTITLTDPDDYVGTITMTKQVPVGTVDNPLAVTLDDGVAYVPVDWDAELYISLPAGVYTLSTESESVAVWHNGDLVALDGSQITVSDGDEIVLEGGFFGGTVIITEVTE